MSYDLKITVFNNRDYKQEFTLNKEDSTALNLTGLGLIFSVKLPDKVLTHTLGNSSNKCIFVEDSLTGQIRLELPYSVLKTIPEGNHPHDLILVDSTGKRSGVWSGILIVKKGAGV